MARNVEDAVRLIWGDAGLETLWKLVNALEDAEERGYAAGRHDGQVAVSDQPADDGLELMVGDEDHFAY